MELAESLCYGSGQVQYLISRLILELIPNLFGEGLVGVLGFSKSELEYNNYLIYFYA